MIRAADETLDQILQRCSGQPRYLVEVLQDVQELEGYISEPAMSSISERLKVPLIEVYRVANFYKAFSLEPRGKFVITVCMGTACHVRRAGRMIDEVAGQLGIEPGGTTEDGLFTLESVNCLGACALGPVILLNGECHHHMTPGKLRKLIQATRKAEEEATANAETA